MNRQPSNTQLRRSRLWIALALTLSLLGTLTWWLQRQPVHAARATAQANTPPTATLTEAVTDQNQISIITLTGTDPDGGTLTAFVSLPAEFKGTMYQVAADGTANQASPIPVNAGFVPVTNADRKVAFAPQYASEFGYNYTTFQYRLLDAQGASSDANNNGQPKTVSVTLRPPQLPPGSIGTNNLKVPNPGFGLAGPFYLPFADLDAPFFNETLRGEILSLPATCLPSSPGATTCAPGYFPVSNPLPKGTLYVGNPPVPVDLATNNRFFQPDTPFYYQAASPFDFGYPYTNFYWTATDGNGPQTPFVFTISIDQQLIPIVPNVITVGNPIPVLQNDPNGKEIILNGNDPIGNGNNGENFIFKILSLPSKGSLIDKDDIPIPTAPSTLPASTIQEGWKVTYFPGLNQTGLDSFTFTITQGNIESSVTSVQLNIVPSGSNLPPTVVTNTATNVAATSATLNGTANGATGWFRYATTNPGTCNDTFGTRAPASGDIALGNGTSSVPFAQAISGLTKGTTYYYCALAQNSAGTGLGAVQSFVTPSSGCVTNPAVTTQADSGAGSLRQAVADACDGSTITFAAGVTGPITLTSGQITLTKNLTINGGQANAVTLSGNNASRIFTISNGQTVTLNGLTLTGGNAGSGGTGGAILNSGRLTVSNTTVTGNTTSFGGGLFNHSSGNLTLNQVTVSSNTAVTGGGIYNNGGSVTIKHSTLSGNQANTGGGGGIYHTSGTLRATNATLSGNTASTSGGGVLNDNNGTTTLTHVTITDNGAGLGGGVYKNSGTIHLRNSIIAANRNNATIPDVDVSFNVGGYNSAGFNLIGNRGTVTGFVSSDQTNLLDPRLEGLANNGGLTQTHGLRAGSPALNAGNYALSLDEDNQPLATDQRGSIFARVANNTVDIGAYELHCPALTISPSNTTLPAGTVGTSYSQQFTQTGGTGTITWSLSPAIPGLTINADGLLSGLPTAAQNATPITITAVDENGCGGRQSYALTIAKTTPVLTWNPPAAINAGVALSAAQLNATTTVAGTFTYTPPAGTVFNVGTYTLTANFTPADPAVYNPASKTVTLTVSNPCGIDVRPLTLNPMKRNDPFVQTLSATPTGSYVFSLAGGTLPPGVSLVNTLGIYSLRGKPTTRGTYTFTLKAKQNNSPCEGVRTYTVTVS